MISVVAPDVNIDRFLRNSNHLRPGKGRPPFTALLPKGENGKISVYRTSGLADSDVRALGTNYVQGGFAPLKGYAVLCADQFFAHALDLVSDPEPHPRHANVTGWESDAKNRLIAKDLADAARLVAY